MIKPDKTVQLKQYLDECESQAFSWGQRDCALFAADWVKLRTGTDHAANLRGQYQTELQSKTVLEEHGFRDLPDALYQLLGEPLSSAMFAQRGDVALVKTPIGIASGIVTAGGVMARGYRSLKCIPLSNIVSAWRVN